MIEFIGNGQGDHRPHEFMYPSKFDKDANVVFTVTDKEHSYDWMAVSQEGDGCDYLVKVTQYKIDC
jgi:hypothetical protein